MNIKLLQASFFGYEVVLYENDIDKAKSFLDDIIRLYDRGSK